MDELHEHEVVAYPPVAQTVNGIFQGGGAKGIVYCAALHELRARGIWFNSVVGASAGAITATLIAIGYTPAQILDEAEAALKGVRKNILASDFSNTRSFFSVDNLESWLEEQLRRRTGVSGRRVEFRDIDPALGFIELNVVAMDLATRHPIVFSPNLTPSVSVAEAVIASSAIPVAMPPRRIAVSQSDGAYSIHRVVDGGTWANYPAFVYLDHSFRAYHGLDSVEPGSTIGFVIEPRVYGHGQDIPLWPPIPPRPRVASSRTMRDVSPRRSPFDLGSARRLGTVGAIASWSVLRWMLLVSVFAGLAALALWWNGFKSMPQPVEQHVPEVLQPAVWVLVSLSFSLALAGVALVWILVVRFGAEVVEVGMPSIMAMLSIGPSVPAWVGSAQQDRVIRLSAPLGISTTQFRPDYFYRRMALVVSGQQARQQLDQLYPDLLRVSEEDLPALDFLMASRAFVSDSDAYRHELRRTSEKKRQKRGFGWIFIGVLPLLYVVTLIAGYSTFPLVVTIPVLALVGLLLARSAVAGRIYNQQLVSAAPQRLRWVGRIVLGAFLVVIWWAFGVYTRPSQGDFMDDIFSSMLAVFLLGGLGCFMSGLSRLYVNRRMRRYLREVGQDTQQSGTT